MDEIKKLLQLDRWPDLICSPYGIAVKKRPDRAPNAYEIRVNPPLSGGTMEKLVNFATGADETLVRRLYSLCNGLTIGATKFLIYGVHEQIEMSGPNIGGNFPLDINVPNHYERPKSIPHDQLIVGSSTEKVGALEDCELTHVICPNGMIRVFFEPDCSKDIRKYDAVDDWLKFEVEQALGDDTRY